MDASMPTLKKFSPEDAVAMSHGFDALDAAVKDGLISTVKWMESVEDAYNNPKAVAYFLQGCRKWSPAEQGRGLSNYLKQYHPQEA